MIGSQAVLLSDINTLSDIIGDVIHNPNSSPEVKLDKIEALSRAISSLSERIFQMNEVHHDEA